MIRQVKITPDSILHFLTTLDNVFEQQLIKNRARERQNFGLPSVGPIAFFASVHPEFKDGFQPGTSDKLSV